VNLVNADLTERRSVFDIVADSQPDVVHHLAAQSSVSASWNDPLGTLINNATSQHHVLEAVLNIRPEARVLVVGSCDEYGNVPEEQNPVSESRALVPLNPYALSKVVQDLMGGQFAASSDLQVVRARPFLQIGPRRAPRFVAGSFARQVAEIEAGLREPRITVGNVDLQRDFTDVRDVVQAYARLGENGRSGEVYNIASGTAHTLREMVDIMMEIAGVRARIEVDPHLMRRGEGQLLTGDASKIRDQLGWSPMIPFEQSVRDTVDYWRGYVKQALVRQGD